MNIAVLESPGYVFIDMRTSASPCAAGEDRREGKPQQAYPRFGEFVDRLWAQEELQNRLWPNFTLPELVERVAEVLGISTEKVRRHTKDPTANAARRIIRRSRCRLRTGNQRHRGRCSGWIEPIGREPRSSPGVRVVERRCLPSEGGSGPRGPYGKCIGQECPLVVPVLADSSSRLGVYHSCRVDAGFTQEEWRPAALWHRWGSRTSPFRCFLRNLDMQG